jgi:hypothetical protein
MVKEYAQATIKNRDFILKVLKHTLPKNGLVLEIASGSGEHASYFAPRLQGLTWQPSEPNPKSRSSISSWAEETQGDNLLAPLDLDVLVNPWPVPHADAIVCINMLHISPWVATKSLIAGAARTLSKGGILYLYGPFKIEGKHTAISNQTFHQSLKIRNAQWGIRDVVDVIYEAKTQGFQHAQNIQMPANNLSVIFERN